MHPHLHVELLITFLDFACIAVGAIGGALHAQRHLQYQYDIIGAFGLAFVSALGGGIVRDVLLNHGPPLALTDVWYLYTAFLAAAATLLFGTHLGGNRAGKVMLIIDAAAVALFAVAGTARAEDFGLTWFPAIMLGITTAVGGGSLRDVLSGTTPRVFERGNFYAIAALAAAVTYLLLDHLVDRYGLPQLWSIIPAALVGFTLRMLSVHFNWRTDALRISRH